MKVLLGNRILINPIQPITKIGRFAVKPEQKPIATIIKVGSGVKNPKIQEGCKIIHAKTAVPFRYGGKNCMMIEECDVYTITPKDDLSGVDKE